jgi:hypothetical protein
MNEINLPVGQKIMPSVRAINSIGPGIFSTEVSGNPIPDAYKLPSKPSNAPKRHD